MDFLMACLNNIGFGAGLIVGFSAGMLFTNKGPWEVIDKMFQAWRDHRIAKYERTQKKADDHAREKELADNFELDDRLVYVHKKNKVPYCYYCAISNGKLVRLPSSRTLDSVKCHICGKDSANIMFDPPGTVIRFDDDHN